MTPEMHAQMVAWEAYWAVRQEYAADPSPQLEFRVRRLWREFCRAMGLSPEQAAEMQGVLGRTLAREWARRHCCSLKSDPT